jgi:hypothetical protein
LAASLLVALVAMLVWWVPGAAADTTVIGEQNLVPNAAAIDQLGQNIPVFQGDAGGGYVLGSPRAGTITSWSFLSGGVATGSRFELAVLAPTGQTGTGWRLLASSDPVAVSSATGTDAVNGPFPVQIPIDVGQRIALVSLDDANVPIESGTQNMDGIRFFSEPFASVGSSQDVVSTADSGQVVPIQATVAFTGAALPPVNTAPPSVSGTPRQFETLTGDPGLWQNGVGNFTYSWLRCAPDGTHCVALTGADSTTYTATREDIGFTLRFQVIASNGSGDSPPLVSAPTAVVQRGVITAKLTVSPNPSCTGVPTRFDGSGSVSPDGIKSFSFSLIDLYAAAENTASRNGGSIDTETAAEFGVALESDALTSGGTDAQFLINNFAGRPQVTGKPTISETFDWNRPAIFSPDDRLTPGPYDLARDPVGVLLVVTDYAGATASAVAVVDFAQHVSSGSRSRCPDTRRFLLAPNAVLAAALAFPRGSSQPSTVANCRTRVTCVGAITVVVRTHNSRAVAAAHRRVSVLASGFFNIPPHHKRKVALKLTQLGKRQLHRGTRLPVTVTVTSVSPTGRSIKHSYTEVLTRR